jgi:Uma2 family endonuclease
VEIILPESIGRDRGEKFLEYEAGGVREYWLVDPERQWCEFWNLEGNRYRLTCAGASGEYRSPVIAGLAIRIEWFWQRPLPRVRDILERLTEHPEET